MKKKKKRFAKLKKVLAGFLALVLVVGLTIVGTLAYLSTQSNKVTNVFTATGNIKLNLIEPSFDSEEASKFKPAGEYPKDPTLVNTTGDDSSEWVILRVDYMVSPDEDTAYSNMSKDDIIYKNQTTTKLDAANKKGLITIGDFPGSDWIKLDLSSSWLTNASKVKQAGSENAVGKNAICEFYVYKKSLSSDGNVKNKTTAELHNMNNIGASVKTSPLFSKITVHSQEQLELNGYTMDTLPRFKIDIVGGAIKNEGDDSTLTGGKTELDVADTKSQTIMNNLLGLVADKTPSNAANSSSSLG
ncbi:MAG: hypothetical protein K2N51_10825 [Lachnospiraceae bacterium]|nr:hypothetical protein [Lachnospiraceae bacterium]